MIIAKILNVVTDQNGNIQVQTEYKKDGKVIQVGNTRYSLGASSTIDEIKNKISEDINTHCSNLISRTYVKNINVAIVPTLLNDIVGQEVSVDNATIVIGDNELTVDETKIISSKPKPIIIEQFIKKIKGE